MKPVTHIPDPGTPEPQAGQVRWANDRLISIRDIRKIFGLGRTAAYELTHRPDFPEPVPVSPRCYRWWASEIDAFAASLRDGRTRPARRRRAKPPYPGTPRRITGKVRTSRTRKGAS